MCSYVAIAYGIYYVASNLKNNNYNLCTFELGLKLGSFNILYIHFYIVEVYIIYPISYVCSYVAIQ